MCNFEEIYVWSKNRIVWHGGPKIAPNGPHPPPYPHPQRHQKFPARGQQVRKNSFVIFFYDLYEKIRKPLMNH